MTKGHPQKEMEAAKEFLIWFTNIENAIRWHKGTGYFPIRKSSVQVLEKEHWFERNPAYKAAFDQLLKTKADRATQGALMGPFPQIRTIIEQAVEQVLAGKASVDDALADAKKKADKALQDYNKSIK
jgi:sn-glycerol 3-phosphate transport system substrate-binding protein